MKKVLLAALMIVGISACTSETITAPEPAKATTVSLNVTAAQLEIGRTVNITATVKDQRDSVMTGKTITWASNNTSIATVSQTGVVTAVGRGQASIVASFEGKSATATIFVVDPTVSSVALTATLPAIFYVGQTIQATALPKDGLNNTLSGFAVTWTSSAPAVATVSSTGLITAVAAGTTTITATSGGKSGTLNVTVTMTPVARVALSLPKAAKVGRTVTVMAELFNSTGAVLNQANRTLGWHSSDETIATISPTGVITGLNYGTTIISCVVENKVGVLVVNVTEVDIDFITVTPDSSDLKVGATRQYTATAFDVDSVPLSTAALHGRSFTWSSANSAVAVVSNTGLVLGVTPGTTLVTAGIGVVYDNAKVVIVP